MRSRTPTITTTTPEPSPRPHDTRSSIALSADPYCPFLLHFLLCCPRFYSHRTALRSQPATLGITIFNLPTLLGGLRHPPILRVRSPNQQQAYFYIVINNITILPFIYFIYLKLLCLRSAYIANIRVIGIYWELWCFPRAWEFAWFGSACLGGALYTQGLI